MARQHISPQEITKDIDLPTSYGFERVKKLHGNLALPSYVHGYSLAIEYLYNWFKSKFDKDFFRGGIYIDGKNVLDDYKRLNDYAMRNIVKGQNPRARMEPRVEYDYDREGLDLYQAPAEVYLRRSKYQDSFFKDYDRDIFLGFMPRALKMTTNFKVRVNSRSQQLDTYNRMELYFRNGSTQYEYISADFHVPKYIMLNIANRAGFQIINGEVVDIIEFIQYLNQHSDIPFLFKLRAINQQPEFFIRLNNIYAHIAVMDKLQLDDGERDGKLDFNFHIDMNVILEIPIPHYYSYYSADELTSTITVKENEDCVALYSINIMDIPKVDEHGWGQAAYTDYQTDEGDINIDISPILRGSNSLTNAINHDLTLGISPKKYINIKVYRDDDIAKEVDFDMDWINKTIEFKYPAVEEVLHIVMYYDRDYINSLETEVNKYNESRIATTESNLGK